MKRRFSLYRRLSQALRLPLAGPMFRLYAPRRRWSSSVASSAASPRPRILIANLMPSLGDTVCYMAMLEVLRGALPHAEITWLADGALAGLLALHPDVDHVLSVEGPHSRLLRVPTLKTNYRLLSIVNQVRALPMERPFDLAIVPRGGIDPSFSAHAVWMLNPLRSAGYSRLVEPEESNHNFGDALLTELETRLPARHEATRAIHLLAFTGLVPYALQRFNPESALRGVGSIAATFDRETLLRKAGVPADRRFVVLAPGAGAAHKAWPARSYQQLCRRIVAETQLNVVVTGTEAEAQLCALVAEGCGDRSINCAGKLSLAELAALLSHAAAFVGNDSGAGHVAGALGAPVVSLHTQAQGSSHDHFLAPEHYRPLGPNVTVLQPETPLPPCVERCEASTAHCITQITVDAVWTALAAHLKG